MTIKSLFEYIREIKPHPFPDDVLLIWLNELEGRVQLDIFLVNQENLINKYVLPDDKNTELLIKAPHTSIYRYYIEAMVKLESGEYKGYQNSMEAFNAAWNQYACWHAEKGSENA